MTRQRKSWDVEGLSCCRKMEGLELLLPKYDGKDHKGAVVWINKMDGIFESNPSLGEREKVMTASNSLEGEAYDW
jgi:hypothetical protein